MCSLCTRKLTLFYDWSSVSPEFNITKWILDFIALRKGESTSTGNFYFMTSNDMSISVTGLFCMSASNGIFTVCSMFCPCGLSANLWKSCCGVATAGFLKLISIFISFDMFFSMKDAQAPELTIARDGLGAEW